jgi:hypothetical protein
MCSGPTPPAPKASPAHITRDRSAAHRDGGRKAGPVPRIAAVRDPRRPRVRSPHQERHIKELATLLPLKAPYCAITLRHEPSMHLTHPDPPICADITHGSIKTLSAHIWLFFASTSATTRTCGVPELGHQT